jgi:hypothetical protein
MFIKTLNRAPELFRLGSHIVPTENCKTSRFGSIPDAFTSACCREPLMGRISLLESQPLSFAPDFYRMLTARYGEPD